MEDYMNKKQKRLYMKEYRKNNREKINEYNKQFRNNPINAEYNRRCSLRYLYYSKSCTVIFNNTRLYIANNYFDAIKYIWDNKKIYNISNCEIRSIRNKIISMKNDIDIILKDQNDNLSIESIESIVRNQSKRWVKQ
jgi:hypothetical protein